MADILLIIVSLATFMIGFGLKGFFEGRSKRKVIDELVKTKRENFDLKLKRNDAAIDATPIEDLLKPGEYLRRKQD